MRVPTFLGRELCHILAVTCDVVELLRLSPCMKVFMAGVCVDDWAFLYPLFAVYPKNGESPNGGVACQCHSLGSHGSSWINPVSKIQ
jgi:hypothetical protein